MTLCARGVADSLDYDTGVVQHQTMHAVLDTCMWCTEPSALNICLLRLLVSCVIRWCMRAHELRWSRLTL